MMMIIKAWLNVSHTVFEVSFSQHCCYAVTEVTGHDIQTESSLTGA